MNDLEFIVADDDHVSEDGYEAHIHQIIEAQMRILRSAATIDDLPGVVEVARRSIDPDDDARYPDLLAALTRLDRIAQSMKAPQHG